LFYNNFISTVDLSLFLYATSIRGDSNHSFLFSNVNQLGKT